MRKIFFSAILVIASVVSAMAADVTAKITMNAVSTTMTMVDGSSTPVAVGTPSNKVYTFTVPEGTYTLTGYATDGSTINGTIQLEISASSKEFAIQTITFYSANSGFVYGTDYSVDLNLKDPNGNNAVIMIGNSITAGRKTFLAVKGSKTNADFTPSAARQAEGFKVYQDTRNRTLNSNTTITATLPQDKDFTITVPANAEAQLAQKTKDYVAFTSVTPTSVETVGTNKVYHYAFTLTATGSQYFYRVWGDGLYTHAGTVNIVAGLQDMEFTQAQLTSKSPDFIDHDVTSNNKYNVGDVFVNINPQGHLKMKVGDHKDVISLRTWQLTNNATLNMFVEPEMDYKVINLAGQEDNTVITFDNYKTSIDPWVTMTAVGNGTAIVLVTYKAMCAKMYDKATVTDYLGGADWSAIWPENTGVFVVTVGDAASGIKSNMYANKGMNDVEHKLAADTLDAEHDVIYYLQADGSGKYTFKPEGVASVKIAYPVIGANSATYDAFQTVDANADGSYTLTLKQGRQIVQMTNADGVSDYQVITAKPCTRTITNTTRTDGTFHPGDKVEIQYAGLFHPNNKLSRIYNMSAYITYNGVPAGSSMVGSANQYNFAATPAAQLYTNNLSLEAEGEVLMQGGCIQINGYGDPVGNHRNLNRTEGREMITAPSHKTYLGILPDIKLEITGALKHHTVHFDNVPAGAKLFVINEKNDTLEANAAGDYDVVVGAFTYMAVAAGYDTLYSAFTVSPSQDDVINVALNMATTSAAWDGTTKTEPAQASGVYQITNGAELAWLAETANTATTAIDAVLVNDINLGYKPWTPIATNANPYLGTFDGQNNTISGLYINATTTYQGLFGKVKGTVKNLTVEGNVNSTTTHAAGVAGALEIGRITNCHFRGNVYTPKKDNVAGIVAYVGGAGTIVDGCSAQGHIAGGANAGGIVGNLSVATNTIDNCYNMAHIAGTGYVGGIVGKSLAGATIKNAYNAGNLQVLGTTSWSGETFAKTVGAINGLTAYVNHENCYATFAYNNEIATPANKTQVLGLENCANGELAYKIDWGQKLGTDPYPIYGKTQELKKVNYYEQGQPATTIYTEPKTLGEKWFGNLLGWYHNASNEAVTEITSDTALYASVKIKPSTGVATFEERTFKPETAWYKDPDFVPGYNDWTSGNYTLKTYMDDQTALGYGIYYYDITMANLTSKEFSWLNPYYDLNCAAGGAAQGTNYAIWCSNYMGNSKVELNTPATISGMAVTNTAWAVNAIKNGDGRSVETEGTGLPFHKGDSLVLIITGYDNLGVATGSIKYFLADFRDASVNYDWTYAENWQWIDLTSLGTVSAIGFAMEGSKHNSYGMTTPAYFCLDNLGGNQADCTLGELTHIKGSATGLENTDTNAPVLKLFRDGQIYILRDGKLYTITGAVVE